MHSVVPVLLSYLAGSVTFSVIVGYLLKGVDIRQFGSGNAGATNTLRVLGAGPALLVFVLDLGKGVLAVWIGKWLGSGDLWIQVICGLGAIVGHNWPVFFKFRGGKGIATTIGVLLTLCFWPVIIAGSLAIACIVTTRYVSLGSLIFVTLLPIAALIWNAPEEIVWASLFILVFAYIRHKTNIVKLLNGKENKIGSKSRG